MYTQPTARSALGSPERGAGSPNGLTEGFSCSVYGQTPPPHVRSAPPLPGEAWALRASNSDTYYIIYKLFTHAIVVRTKRPFRVLCAGLTHSSIPTVHVRKPPPSIAPLCPISLRADSIRPYRACAKRFLSGIESGGLELTYRYTPRSVIVRRHCRPQPIFRIMPTIADRRINQMG